ncbi:MAG TPA: OB-fold nucleic acid binding domain-containing protein, partial [Fodinibius sp.]|nr:OB-fold nucleic acid binding domain-containing protein [Fodinibius sp.]
MELLALPNLNKKRLKALSESGISSTEDLLNFFPRRYIDRTTISRIRTLRGEGEEATVVGRIQKIQLKGRGRKKRLEIIIHDHTGALKGVWFKGGHYIKKQFTGGQLVAFFGKIKKYGRSLSIAHPEVDTLDDESEAKDLRQIVPVYPGNKSLSKTYTNSKIIRRWQKAILKQEKPPEFLPESIL